MTKEQPRANCSGHSWQNSDCEQFAQVTLFLWVTWANGSKTSDLLEKNRKNRFFLMFFTVFPLSLPKSKSSNCSSLSHSFVKEQPWANRSGHSVQNSNREQFAQVAQCSWQKSDGSNLLFFTSESLFRSQKTSDSLQKPMSKFPTLQKLWENCKNWVPLFRLRLFWKLICCVQLYTVHWCTVLSVCTTVEAIEK